MKKSKTYITIIEGKEQSSPKPAATHSICLEILAETNTDCLWVYQCMFAMRGVKYKPMDARRLSNKTGFSQHKIRRCLTKLKQADFYLRTVTSSSTSTNVTTYLGRLAVCLYHVRRLFGEQYASFYALLVGRNRVAIQDATDTVMASDLSDSTKDNIINILIQTH